MRGADKEARYPRARSTLPLYLQVYVGELRLSVLSFFGLYEASACSIHVVRPFTSAFRLDTTPCAGSGEWTWPVSFGVPSLLSVLGESAPTAGAWALDALLLCNGTVCFT
jgi:hypothetical protein